MCVCVRSYDAFVLLAPDRPLYLPIRSLLVVETFSISSSVSLDHSSSTLRYERVTGLVADAKWRFNHSLNMKESIVDVLFTGSFWMKLLCFSRIRVMPSLSI